MPSADDRPALYSVDGGVLSLSGPALKAFLGDVLGRGVPFRFRARGMSMDPFIRDGDVITVVPLRARPRLGDVIACCRPGSGRLMVHRVVATEKAGPVVRGDANDAADGAVAWAEVLGAVSAVRREGRPVLIGRGPERLLVAYLSRRGALRPLVAEARRVVRRVRGVLARKGATSGGQTRG